MGSSKEKHKVWIWSFLLDQYWKGVNCLDNKSSSWNEHSISLVKGLNCRDKAYLHTIWQRKKMLPSPKCATHRHMLHKMTRIGKLCMNTETSLHATTHPEGFEDRGQHNLKKKDLHVKVKWSKQNCYPFFNWLISINSKLQTYLSCIIYWRSV